jgi:hypothetical protein
MARGQTVGSLVGDKYRTGLSALAHPRSCRWAGRSGGHREPPKLLVRLLQALQHLRASKCQHRVMQTVSEWIVSPEDALDGVDVLASEQAENPSKAERPRHPSPSSQRVHELATYPIFFAWKVHPGCWSPRHRTIATFMVTTRFVFWTPGSRSASPARPVATTGLLSHRTHADPIRTSPSPQNHLLVQADSERSLGEQALDSADGR